jgi:AcrR family transcriptional regulator
MGGTQTQTSERQRPGRPRSERSRQSILAAAGALLHEQGLRAMTIEAVAARAGVSKKTIYRWWPSRGVLALDAIYAEWSRARGVVPNRGTLQRDLRARMRATVRVLNSPALGSTLAALIAEAQTDPELAHAYNEHVLMPLREQIAVILERAITRGELPTDLDREAAIDLLQGPLFLRLLHTHAPLDQPFADTIVRLAIGGLQDGTAGKPQTRTKPGLPDGPRPPT